MFNRFPCAGVRRSFFAALALALAAASCSGEDAVPADQTTSVTVSGAHVLEPNDEMRRLAEQQCLDDPLLERGEIRAVDPADPDQALAVVTVACADVR